MKEIPEGETWELISVPEDAAGMRVDTWLARRQDVHSRTYFQQLIKDGRVLVDGQTPKRSAELEGNEQIQLRFPPPTDPWPRPQDIPISVLHEDDDLIVVNKAAGMIVHPASGNPDGTLVNALLSRYPDLPGIKGERRPGIVHRLDRDTSGVMIVCKNDRSMRIMANAIKERRVSRLYLAMIIGDPDWEETTVDAPIGRDESFRIRRAVDGPDAKHAVTRLRVLARNHGFALLRCKLETGRTHQIRVHCSHVGMPIVGDHLYGGVAPRVQERLQNKPSDLRAAFTRFERPFLHARIIRFHHPSGGHPVEFRAPLPADMAALLAAWLPDSEPEQLASLAEAP